MPEFVEKVGNRFSKIAHKARRQVIRWERRMTRKISKVLENLYLSDSDSDLDSDSYSESESDSDYNSCSDSDSNSDSDSSDSDSGYHHKRGYELDPSSGVIEKPIKWDGEVFWIQNENGYWQYQGGEEISRPIDDGWWN